MSRTFLAVVAGGWFLALAACCCVPTDTTPRKPLTAEEIQRLKDQAAAQKAKADEAERQRKLNPPPAVAVAKATPKTDPAATAPVTSDAKPQTSAAEPPKPKPKPSWNPPSPGDVLPAARLRGLKEPMRTMVQQRHAEALRKITSALGSLKINWAKRESLAHQAETGINNEGSDAAFLKAVKYADDDIRSALDRIHSAAARANEWDITDRLAFDTMAEGQIGKPGPLSVVQVIDDDAYLVSHDNPDTIDFNVFLIRGREFDVVDGGKIRSPGPYLVSGKVSYETAFGAKKTVWGLDAIDTQDLGNRIEVRPFTTPERKPITPPLRTWKDDSGTFSIRAYAVGSSRESIKLVGEDGNARTVSIDRLSPECQEWAKAER